MEKNLDPINPLYYNGSISCIDAMEAAFGPVATTNFCHLNAFKYLWRAGQKEGNSTVQDFEKAGWYINKAVELVIKQEKDEH